MCDTMLATPSATDDGLYWLAKNSDREPGEAQVVEHLPRREALGGELRCTWIEVPQVDQTWECVLSRPFWMWGAEMGVNENGVAIGNEAVFTRVPVAEKGLTGMDLLRLALERATTARGALTVITDHLARYDQGGSCGYRHRDFRYHSSFAIGGPSEAWILETAGRHWAAKRVRGVATISNALTIQRDWDLISDDAIACALDQGWTDSVDDFGFAEAFSDPVMSRLSGASTRRARTQSCLTSREPKLALEDFMSALRDHAGRDPSQGIRMAMPCAHASWLPTRSAGQTTGSLVARLGTEPLAWLTGTSSPCISVFKPVPLGRVHGCVDTGPTPGAGWDNRSLFWRHERLHRAFMRRPEVADIFRSAKEILEMEVLRDQLVSEPDAAWAMHRRHVGAWADRAWEAARRHAPVGANDWFWQWHDFIDEVPSESPDQW